MSLHKLCHQGDLKRVREVVDKLNEGELTEKLATQKGVFHGYTPLHEAVASGNPNVLEFLLQKAKANVDIRAKRGYTPLHVAASMGHEECVKVLLNHGADVSLRDEYGKTPRQTAELSSKHRIVRLLRSEEVIKEVERNGENLTELLRLSADQLEPNCLNRALAAAVNNDHQFNIGKLIIKGADNIEDCLRQSRDHHKPHARAMLLLVKAAMQGDQNLVQKVFGEPVPEIDTQEYQDESFKDAQKALLGGEISTVVPIEIARRNGHTEVRGELLLKTDVNVKEGTVYWHGLRLLVLDVSWLKRIDWVRKLRLARNGLKQLPDEIRTCLKQVVKLDLQHNELQTVPSCLLELPSLSELNLNHNKLVEIPNIPEWSPSLTVLELSHNQLTTVPPNTIATAIQSLNLSYNMFSTVPQCVCSFTTLHSLNLSHNPDIRALPAEMGKLTNLTSLQLEGLKDLSDPPRNMQKDTQECIRYLNSKLRGTKSVLVNPVQDGPETIPETPNKQAINPVQIVKPQTYTAGISQEMLDVKLPSNDLVRISCPKPAKLGHVLSELQVNSGLDEDQCKIKYYKGDSRECIQIQTQEQLDHYLQTENRPQLYLSRST